MGVVTSLVVGIVGIILVFIINWIPVDILIKIIPICWIPNVHCENWYDKIKMYLLVILLAIIMFFIPCW